MHGKEDLNLYKDTLMIHIDPDFSTSHDYMVSKIIANDRLRAFLNTEIKALAIKNQILIRGILRISYKIDFTNN